MTRPTRRAVIIVPDEVLERILTTTARLDLPKGTRVAGTTDDPVRLATLILITGENLDEVAPGYEPVRIPATIIEGP